MKISVGDRVELKKPHPCGGKTFEIMRVGMDFRLRCQTCEAQIWLTRPNLEKRVRRHWPVSPEAMDAAAESAADIPTYASGQKQNDRKEED